MRKPKDCKCGSGALVISRFVVKYPMLQPNAYVECKRCHASTPLVCTVRGAIKIWNRRAKDEL